MDNLLLLIDGNSLAFRAFYALPPFTNREGLHTNAILGFCNILFKLIEQENPEYIIVAFDTKAPTYRHQIYHDYKGTRQKSPDEFNQQIPMLKEVIKAMGIEIYEQDGFEADDIIGTLSKKCSEKGINTKIITGDKDVFQLVNHKVQALITRKGISEIDLFTIGRLAEDYSLSPEQFIDLKALMGDKSDNIPGIPGIGEKTALKLLHDFGSIDGIYNNLDKLTGKLKEKIETNKEICYLSKELVKIDTKGPFEASGKWEGFDKSKLFELFTQLEFKTLMERLNIKGEEVVETKVTLEITEPLPLSEWLKAIEGSPYIAISLEYQGEDGRGNMPFALSLANKKGVIWFDHEEVKDLPEDIKKILTDSRVKKGLYDGKNSIHSFKAIGINLTGITYDLSIISYLINPEARNTLSDISYRYLSIELESLEELTGKGKNKIELMNLPKEKTKDYSTKKAALIYQLIEPVVNDMRSLALEDLYYNMELPLIVILFDMEDYGFKVDGNQLEELSKTFTEEIRKVTEEIYDITGQSFNINSPKQLSEFLFDRMGLPVIKRTKTGISTDNEVLEKLSKDYPVVSKIQTYRLLSKIKTTYIEGLLNLMDPITGKVHTSLKQTVTATGRLSSTEPNLQNIPIKIEMGRQLRKVFVPTDKNYVLISADYSQIELRILAHISKDESLIDAYVKNQDIHTRTASEVFSVPMDMVTGELRSRAKAVNFGIVYGISDFGLSNDLNISRKEAKTYIDSYFARYPGVKKYIDDIIAQGREKGFVKTIYNRVRFMPELNNRNFTIRSFAERTAMNSPIQGSAADIIKAAMVSISNLINEKQLPLNLLLQVHDELVFQCPEDKAMEMIPIIKGAMENVINLAVPLVVDIKVGPDWYNVKKIGG